MFKKVIFIVVLIIFASTLAACSAANEKAISDNKDGKLSIVCTIYPQYDWINKILGDQAGNVDLTLLVDNGVDLHNYQPTAGDIAKISSCDLFIYVGGESDSWIDDALVEATNKDMIVIDLLDVLNNRVKQEKIVEGMESKEQEADGKQAVEYDEHVWLSLKNAVTICGAIKDALCQLDSAHADTYETNADSYLVELNDLDAEYQQMVVNASRNTVVFGDRFPFRYLMDDYGIKYFAAFPGCSAETEASFKTVVFLAGKVDLLGLNSVIVIEGSDQSIAHTIIDNTADQDQQVLVMDSMQSVTAADVKNGKNYLSIMRNNLDVLQQALN